MYDIPELEKKWRKYKRKQIQKPLLITVAALLIIGGGAALIKTYLSSKNNVPKSNVAATSTVQSESKKSNDAIIITKVNPVQSAQTQNSENGGIDLSKAEIVKPNVPDDDIRVIGFDNKDKQKIKKKYEDILVPKQSVEEIKEKEKVAEIEDRFKETQDPQDSLYLAKYYYKIGNYKKAENQAVNTNNIDGDIEESWLIFAKARAKQGFRVDAIKVLQSYYDETHSPKAKELLDKLRRNIPFKQEI